MKQWVCTICGEDTSNVEYDYLVNYNHLACELGVWGGHKGMNKKKKMKIKGWEKISGFTYKGYTIVNPIHNAQETKYEATILNLNLPQKPKWELSVLTPQHKFIVGENTDDGMFYTILWDEDRNHISRNISKQNIKSISNFRSVIEEMIDDLLKLKLTSAPTYSSHSLNINPNMINSNSIGGIIGKVNNSGTFSIYDASTGASIDLLDTIKGLQKQIEDLKNTPSNPF